MVLKDNQVGLTREPLDSVDLLRVVGDPAAGGVCVFAGTTRAERSSLGAALLALDYEAYEEMANDQLWALFAQAVEQWPLEKLILLHRVGRVPVGEASVLIAVSTPHRADAFECCRWLIDTLKAELTVWKREVWEDGTTTWTAPNREWKMPEGS